MSNFLIRAVVGGLYVGLGLWVLTAAMHISLPLVALFGDSSTRWRGTGVLLSIGMLAMVPRLWRFLRQLRSDLGLLEPHGRRAPKKAMVA